MLYWQTSYEHTSVNFHFSVIRNLFWLIMFMKSDMDSNVFLQKPALLTAENTCAVAASNYQTVHLTGGLVNIWFFLNEQKYFEIMSIWSYSSQMQQTLGWGYDSYKHFLVSNLEGKSWKLRGKLRVSLGRLFSDKMLFVENGDWPVLQCVPVCACLCVYSYIFLTLCGRLPAVLLFCHPVVLLFSAWNRMWFRLHGSLCNWMD